MIHKPKIAIKKLENRIIPIQNNNNMSNGLNNNSSNNQKILIKKQGNNLESNSGFNQANNEVILLSQENEIANAENNIKRNYISQNQSSYRLITIFF